MSFTSLVRKYVPLPIRQAVGGLRNSRTRSRGALYQEFLSRISAGEALVHAENLKGEFWLDIRSHLLRRIAVSGVYEPDVSAALVANADRDFIDIGANVGFFSIHLAMQTGSGKVLSIEPNPRAYAYLERNIAQNEVAGRVEVVRRAVASESAELELVAFEGREEYSSISSNVHPSVQGLEATRYKVQAEPLDLILKDRSIEPGLIKIDAEGAELQVLQGMEKTITTFRPALICEVGGSTFGSDVQAITKQLKKMNYEIFSLNGVPTVLDPTLGGEILARPIG